MAKLCIALSVVLIFASVANGLFDTSEEKIKSIIEEATLAYNKVRSRAYEFPVEILQKLIPYALNVSNEIVADLHRRENEYRELFADVVDVAPSDCDFLTDRLHQVALKAADALQICVEEQIAAVKVNVTEIERKVDNELDILGGYRASAEKCSVDNAGSFFRIRRCLRRVRRELHKLPKTDFSPSMKDLADWLTNCEIILDSCTRDAVDTYYGHSEVIVEATRRCVETKRDRETELSVETAELVLKNDTTTEE